MTRLYTADDIRTMREHTKWLITYHVRTGDTTIGWVCNMMVKTFDINQAQIYALDLGLSDVQVAAKFHLLTNELKYTHQVDAVYNITS